MKNYKKYLCWPVAMVTLLLIGHAVVAAGHGKGRTMIAFKTSTTDFTASSFFAKIDVSGAVTSNSNVTTTTGGTGTATNTDDGDDDDNQSGGNGHGNGHGKGSGKGNGKGNGNGKGKGHGKSALSNGNGHTANGFNNFSLAGFDVTLTIGSASFTGTADGKGKVHDPFDAKLTANGQILMINASGLDLVELFPLDTTDGKHQVTVTISVSATKTTTDTTGATNTTTIDLSTQDVTFYYCVKNGRAQGKNF